MASAIRRPNSLLLAAGAVALLALGVAPVLRMMAHDDTLPSALTGTWVAASGNHKGRAFKLQPGTLALQTDSQGTLVAHPIISVRRVNADSGITVTIIYDDQGESAQFGLWYIGGGTLRVQNLPEVTWRRVASAQARSQ
jgi:hypothetical protein